MKGLVVGVTGTDTGIGKTFVACLLLKALREQGLHVAGMKPVESGIAVTDSHYPLPAESDSAALWRAAGEWQNPTEVNAYFLSERLSPHLAARRAGCVIDKERIVAGIQAQRKLADLVLVEGAGGVTVPLARQWSFLDLAKELGMPLIVVVGSRLGALNHALLTIEAIKGRGIPLLGYVLNQYQPVCESEREAIATNPEALAELAAEYDCPCLGLVGYGAQAMQIDQTMFGTSTDRYSDQVYV